MATGKRLDMESASPLYRQLIKRMRGAIQSGEYPVNSRIPTEQQLCETYQISRVTVRKALAELTEEGLLERHQGKGTFVAMPRIQKDLRAVNSFTDTCRAMGRTPGTRLLHIEMKQADAADAAFFGCEQGDPLVEAVRVRLADELPVIVEINRFPGTMQWLMQEDLTGSLYDVLRNHGLEPGDATHEISLCYAAEEEARSLDIEPGSAMLLLNEAIYDQDGHPLHRSIQHIRADRYTFRI